MNWLINMSKKSFQKNFIKYQVKFNFSGKKGWRKLDWIKYNRKYLHKLFNKNKFDLYLN